METVQREIAAVAARLVVDEGLDYGAAKRHALKQMGLPARTAVPRNEELEDAVREHIAVFCADTQAVELLALRRLALQWMVRMARFRPYLTGAVWLGTATRQSDIRIELYCDDPKSAELTLLDLGAHFEARTVKGLAGAPVDVLSVHSFCRELDEDVGVHLLVYDRDDIRGARRMDGKDRLLRADLDVVRRLMHDSAP
ncbi:hypothetical protein [Rhodoferax sp.]|uniref:hypothetical protein n=1 Tax=Rhodoferax sp. TaxID=50421 RepID=UPI002762CA90|nr:hypothetical protein [Rhodoferax sp.]